MALVISKKEEIKYIPISERLETKPFTVWFKPLTARQLAKLEDGYLVIRGEDSISLQTGTYNMKAVQSALTRWDNIKDSEEKDIELTYNNKGMVLDSVINNMPSTMLSEIGTVIVNVSKFPDDAELYLGMATVEA